MDDDQIVSNPNAFMITGGPGAGKSTLIEVLRRRGEICVKESGRAIILDQLRIRGRGLPWIDPDLYAELVLARDLANFRTFAGAPSRVFFDRGVAELAGYFTPKGLVAPPHMRRAAEVCRYNRRAFAAPPWQAIYVNDSERKQTFAEAEAVFQAACRACLEQGYELIELPLDSVEARADFVLENAR